MPRFGFGYIGGFVQKYSYSDVEEDKGWRWKDLGEHLKIHPNVKNLYEIEVPYYNAEFCGQMAYEMDVVFESDWYKHCDGRSFIINQLLLGLKKDADVLNVNQFRK